jgi:hypothetical protein
MSCRQVLFQTPRSFLGRNGRFRATGIEVTGLREHGEITIEPITSRGRIGRCCIEVPIGTESRELINAINAACGNHASAEEIRAARALYAAGSDNSIEIDDNALTSRSEDGTWVSAWVWCPREE